MEAKERGDGRKCESEGSEPIVDDKTTKICFDSEKENAALNAKSLLIGKFDKNKVEVIRPGQFMPGPIRESGLKHPLLIKGDRYNFNPHMGVSLTGTGPTATDLADRMNQEKEIETWDVSKQRPGPKWKLEQFFIYWHARQEHVARQALKEGNQPTAAAGQYGNEMRSGDDADLQDDGNSADVLVLAAKAGDGVVKQWHTAAVTQRGINQEQVKKLFCGESISLDHANPNNQAANNKARDDKPPAGPLSDEIHPPPTINNIELVRFLERQLRDLNPKPDDKPQPSTSGAAAAASEGGAQPGASSERGRRCQGGVPDIGPARTMHLQMMPKDGFADFKAAPGGAATWLYVLSGRQTLVLLPPTAKNRSLYMSWAQASLAQTLQSQVLHFFLADFAQDPMRVEVKQNEALLIPAGWFYASAAPEDCISVCCYFWHPYALGDIARTQHMQVHLKQRDTELSRKARTLMWCAALHYTRSLREKLGLSAYRAVRPGGCRLMTPSSSSGGSGMFSQQQQQQLQPRQSPRSRAGSMSISGSAGMGSVAVPRGTPPMSGYAAAYASAGLNQVGESSGLGSPMQSPGPRRGQKRAYSEAMDDIALPGSAIPLSGDAAAAAAAAAEGARTPRATASAAAAAAALAAPAGHKKLKISMSAGGGPVTPRGTQQQQQGFAAAAAAGWAPRPSHSGGTHSAGGAPTTSAGGTLRLTLKGSTAWQAQQQRSAGWGGKSYYSAAAAAADDEELGDCQTSPVRQPPAEAEYLDMFSPGSRPASGAEAAAAGGGSSLEQRQRRAYRQVDLSPIVGGVRGDLDAVPQLNMGAAAVQGGRPNFSESVLGPAEALNAAVAAAAAAQNTPNPKLSKLKMKMTPRPSTSGAAAAAAAGTAAAAASPAGPAAAGRAGWTGSVTPPPNMQLQAAGGIVTPAAAAAAAATGGNEGAAKSMESGGSGGGPAHTGVSTRSTPEESCCRNSSGQGNQHLDQPQQGSGGSDGASHQQQQQQQQQAGGPLRPIETVRSARLSDCAASAPPPPAAAAAAAASGTTPRAAAAAQGGDKAWMKIRLKTPTPSPQLAPFKATAAFEAALPPLQLDAATKQQQQRALQQQQLGVAGAVQQQQQGRAVHRAVPLLQLDRLLPPMQQQPAVHGTFGQQLLQQAQQQQQPEQYVPPVPGGQGNNNIPQVDGAADWPTDLAQQAQPQHMHSHAGPSAQQQQCRLLMQWQQLEAHVLQQQAHGRSQAAAAAATGDAQQQQQQNITSPLQQQYWIPQVDGAGDELRASCSKGPTCVLQPSPAGNGDIQQQQRAQQQQQPSKPRVLPANGTCVVTSTTQQQQAQAGPPGVVARNPAVQSNMQLHQQRAAAAAAAAAAGRHSPSPVDLGPFAAPSGDAAAAAAAGGDVDMLDAPAATAGAAAEGVLSRVGSSHPFAAGEAAAAAAAMLAAMAPGAPPGQQPGSRSNSPTKDTQQQPQQQQAGQVAATTPPPAAGGAGGLLVGTAGPQQQQPMLPPLPTKVSTWELTELPVLLQCLQEQVAMGDMGGVALTDLPAGVSDPGYLLEQLEEAVALAGAQQQEEIAAAARKAGTAAAAAAAAQEAAQQQQHGGARGQAVHARGLAELARQAADWQEQCGELHPGQLCLEELNLDLTEALQKGYAVCQAAEAELQNPPDFDHIEPVIDETDPGATQAGSFHSAGSYQSGAGTARAARGEGRGAAAWAAAQQDQPGGMLGGLAGGPAAAAAAGGGGGAGVGQKRPAAAVNKGAQQEKQKKAAQLKKGLGIGGKR